MSQTLIPQFFGRMKNEIRKRDGEMSQWLRTCLALAEDGFPKLQAIQRPLLGAVGSCTHTAPYPQA